MRTPRKNGRDTARRAIGDRKERRLIGDRILELRARSGGTKAAFAARIDAETDTVSAWEKGEVRPSARHLAAMAREFGVSADWILCLRGGEGDGRLDEGSVAELAHDQVVRETVRLSPRLKAKLVREAIGSPNELWQWLLRYVAARALAEVTSRDARAYLDAVDRIDRVRFDRIMALSTDEDQFPKDWLSRSPTSSPAENDETMQELADLTPTRERLP